MKTIILSFFALVLLYSCDKNDLQIYSANLTQTESSSPIAEQLTKTKKSFSISWKRNAVGVYEAQVQGIEFSKTSAVIDQGTDVNEEIRVYNNNGFIQVYTREWNENLKEWEFSDDVLLKTFIEIKFYK